MKPEDFLKKTLAMEKNMRALLTKSVAVGYPKEKVSSQAYGGGTSVLEVATHHEYGTKHIPRRSMLRVPFLLKAKSISDFTALQLLEVLDKGVNPDAALAKIGVFAMNISREAFNTKGYGQWPDIKEATKRAKGRSSILLTKGILRRSITYVVRG